MVNEREEEEDEDGERKKKMEMMKGNACTDEHQFAKEKRQLKKNN